MDMLVFVYGSLKKGHWNHHVLGDSVLVGTAVTKEAFVLTDCGFPYAIESKHARTATESLTERPIVGEVYHITSEATLARLDALEGVRSNHYNRNIAMVEMDTGEVEAVYMYHASESTAVSALKLRLCPTVQVSESVEAYEWRAA